MACSGGQTPVSCGLCEEDTRIKWKCLNCDMLMCDKCKEKIHVKFKFAKDHKVVSIQDVGLYAEEIDFSNVSCKNHTGQNYVLFCKSCDCLVCPLCISENHNGHSFLAIKEGYEIKIDELKTKQIIMKFNTDELKKRKAEVEDVDRSEHSKLKNTLKKIEAQNSLLKKEVDKHTDKLKSEIMKRWEALHQSTKKEEKEVSLLIGSLESKNSEVDDIIHSKQAERVFVDGLGLVKLTVTSPCTTFDSIPTFLPGQITADNIGLLENVSTKCEIKIIKQFHTEISDVYFMTACSEDTLWIGNLNMLQKLKIEGESLKITDRKDINIFSMAYTPSKNILLISGGPGLKQINDQTGEVTDSKYYAKDLALSAVHVNQDGKVTVGAFSGQVVYPAKGRRVVIVMDISGKHETTYENDKQGNPIFSYISIIARTKSGNFCIVDRLSEDGIGRVVMLRKDNDVLSTFSGHLEVNPTFRPMGALVTPSDKVIVSNSGYNTLYFLNNNGNYIGWCDTSTIGILSPISLSLTKAGRIYIGCVLPEESIDKAKIYEVYVL